MQLTIKGRITEIIYRNSENGYTVASLHSEEIGEITLTGCMPSVREMDIIEARGQWKVHDLYGKQFCIEHFCHCQIDTQEGAFAYLSSGAIEGIGMKMAQRIIRRFGKQAIAVLENNPQAYLEIEGIGRKKLDAIVESHNRGRELREVISVLAPHGISSAYCMKIYRYYKGETLSKVMNNPYSLCRDIRGIGFKKADELAQKLNAGLESKERMEQGLIYILQEAALEGHTYMDLSLLVRRASRLLGGGEEKIYSALEDLTLTDSLVVENMDGQERVYLSRYNLAETRVASNLIRLASSREKIWFRDRADAWALIERLQQKHQIKLSKEQLDVAVEALLSKVLIVTGGPGTGKTTTLSFILRTLSELEKKVTLCAPTGRAAKRITEATGRTAFTIHRLLEAGSVSEENYTLFMRDEDNPIHADALIIDEISMVDILLFDSLLRAVSTGTTLILVGDKDQLPSVGAGSVFKDVLDSAVIPTVRLTEIFRQAKQSHIVVNAHRINKGQMPISNDQSSDFFFMQRKLPSQISSLIVDLVSRRLKDYYGFQDRDIQVLSPMKKSETGVYHLNQMLQEALNPPQSGKREHAMSSRTLRMGDRVMHIKNNYEKTWKNEESGAVGEGIFNGDIGYIDFMEPRERKLYVKFDDGKRVEYDFTELDEIEHAFATTVHKSQGSEFPCVVMPIASMPPMLMSRRILYTAITRAKRILVLVGRIQFLQDMIANIYEEKRNTALCEKLKLFVEHGIILEDWQDGDDLPF